MKWKQINNYPNYSVSDAGLVKRNNTNNLLKPWSNSRGYLYVSLSKNGRIKKFAIHRLVATAFLIKKDQDTEVNHLDENKKNNFSSNLEWVDHKTNLNYGTHNLRMTKTIISKKLGKPVIQFDKKGNYIKRWNSAGECGRNGFNYRHVNECCNHKRCTHAGFIWKYESEVIKNDSITKSSNVKAEATA